MVYQLNIQTMPLIRRSHLIVRLSVAMRKSPYMAKSRSSLVAS
jgi:hypothetical protein